MFHNYAGDCPFCEPEPVLDPKPVKSWIVSVPGPNGPKYMTYYGENAAKSAAESAAIANKTTVRVFESIAVVSPRPVTKPVVWEHFNK